jgi:VanZ family protein
MTWTGVIFVLSFTPGGVFRETPRFNGADWVVHACLYAVLACAMLRDGFYKAGLLVKSPFLSMSFWVVLIGVFTEVVQFAWIPGRSGDLMDLIADYAGFLLVYVIWRTTRVS